MYGTFDMRSLYSVQNTLETLRAFEIQGNILFDMNVLTNCSNLIVIDISGNNNIIGNIQTTNSNALSNTLLEFDVRNNNLSGSIDWEIFRNCDKVLKFQIEGNYHLNGSINWNIVKHMFSNHDESTASYFEVDKTNLMGMDADFRNLHSSLNIITLNVEYRCNSSIYCKEEYGFYSINRSHNRFGTINGIKPECTCLCSNGTLVVISHLCATTNYTFPSTSTPTNISSMTPTREPTTHPSITPTMSPVSTLTPTFTSSYPTILPTALPTELPTPKSLFPTLLPTVLPIALTLKPTTLPTKTSSLPTSSSSTPTTITQLPTYTPLSTQETEKANPKTMLIFSILISLLGISIVTLALILLLFMKKKRNISKARQRQMVKQVSSPDNTTSISDKLSHDIIKSTQNEGKNNTKIDANTILTTEGHMIDNDDDEDSMIYQQTSEITNNGNSMITPKKFKKTKKTPKTRGNNASDESNSESMYGIHNNYSDGDV